MAAKRRADQLLVDQGLAESRAKAQALILAGLVSAGGRRVDKPGTALAEDTELALAGRDHPWVSRGGIKLAFALDHFALDPSGMIALDVGAYSAALEYATGRDALVVGKPSPDFFNAAIADMGADRAVMVGDDVEADVGGALAAGLPGVLVRTGKYRDDALQASGVTPTAIADSIADVPELLGRLSTG